MIVELLISIIFMMVTPLVAPAVTFRLYEINTKYFKKVKIRKLSFLFCGIGGRKSIYGDVCSFGIIVPMFICQILGYIFAIIQIIIIPILLFVVNIQYLTLIVSGSIFSLYLIIVVVISSICIMYSKYRERNS